MTWWLWLFLGFLCYAGGRMHRRHIDERLMWRGPTYD